MSVVFWRRSVVVCGILALCSLPTVTGCAGVPIPISTVKAYSAAKKVGDYDRARSYLSDDPRVWYETREGEGQRLTLGGGGKWSHWDSHFNGHSEPLGPWQTDGRTVWRDFHETNDYFRLLERPGGAYRRTYFLGHDLRIEGTMISAVPSDESQPSKPRGRLDQFLAWARSNEPTESAYLMPAGNIDPTGDRAPRMRKLIERWRQATGLPPIE